MQIELSKEEIEMLIYGLGWAHSEGQIDDEELYRNLQNKLEAAER